MHKLIVLLFFLLGCSSGQKGYQFAKLDTDIEKDLVKEDKSLEKFSVAEVIDVETVQVEDSKTEKENEQKNNEPQTESFGNKSLKKSSEKLPEKTPEKTTEKSNEKSPDNSQSLSKGQQDGSKKQKLLDDLKSKVATDVEKVEEKENPLPEDYPKKFFKYDKEAKKVWKLFEPKIFLNEAHIFQISYLGITVGTIRLETKPPVKLANEPAYHFAVKLKSADYYNYVYSLNDTLESYVRMRDFMPLKFKLVQRESGQEVDDLQVFDHSTHKTTFWYRKLKKGKEKKEKKEQYMPIHFQDSFSVLQFVRGLPLKLGEKYEFPIVTRTKVWIAKMDIVNTLDKVEVAGKSFLAIKVKAETHFPGVLKKRGDVIFWFSNDEQRRLLKFQAKIKIGSVQGELVKFEPGKKLQ